uniref:hypothetical protein n=1 Tax=Rhodococcus oryzae TaxID=2571143 RepID=UPI00145D6A6B|nr:hypothetical protein [Rhodococcus oryzae]
MKRTHQPAVLLGQPRSGGGAVVGHLDRLDQGLPLGPVGPLPGAMPASSNSHFM